MKTFSVPTQLLQPTAVMLSDAVFSRLQRADGVLDSRRICCHQLFSVAEVPVYERQSFSRYCTANTGLRDDNRLQRSLLRTRRFVDPLCSSFRRHTTLYTRCKMQSPAPVCRTAVLRSTSNQMKEKLLLWVHAQGGEPIKALCSIRSCREMMRQF